MAKGRIYELAFRIGGKIASSFLISTSAAGKKLTDLQRKSAALAKRRQALKRFGEVRASFRHAAAGVAVFTGALGLAIKQAAGFETGMAKIATLLDAQGKAQLPALGDAIDRISRQYGLAADTMQEAAFQAISASVPIEQTPALLEVAAKAAVGGFTDMKTAVDGLTNIVNAYHMNAKDAIVVADSFFVANKRGKTTFEELAANMGTVAPIAEKMGVSFQDLGAVIATVTKGGVTTATTVTQLRAALSNVLKPSSEAVKEAERLGIAFGPEAIRQMGGFSKWLKHVKDRTGGSNESLGKLFKSVEAISAIMSLTSDTGLADLVAGLDEMRAGGQTAGAFGDVAKTAAFRWRQLTETFGSFARAIGSAALPHVNALLGDIADKIFEIDGGVKEAVRLKIAEMVRKATDAVREMARSLSKAWDTLSKVVDLLGGWESSIKAVIVAWAAFQIGKVVLGIELLASSTWELNAALLASPITWFVAALLAEIALVALAVKYWEKWTGWLERSSAWVKMLAGYLLLIAPPAWLPLIVATVIKKWDTIKAVFSAAGTWIAEFFSKWGAILLAGIAGPLPLAVTLIIKFWDQVKGAFSAIGAWLSGFWDSWKGALAGVVVWFGEMIGGMLAKLSELADKLTSIPGVGKAIKLVAEALPAAPTPAQRATLEFAPQLAAMPVPAATSAAQLAAVPSATRPHAPLSAPLAGVAAMRRKEGAVDRSIHLSMSPQITVTGDGRTTKDDIRQALKAGTDDLLKQLRAAQEQDARLAYG